MVTVKLSPGERFLNWYPKHTKLYLRGERGRDWAERRALDQELFDELNPFLCALLNEARRDECARVLKLVVQHMARRDRCSREWLLASPCLWCGYNGPNYWSINSHKPGCPWHGVGGIDPRMAAMEKMHADD